MEVDRKSDYALIFVDDEAIVREGISSRIDWGANGFRLSGTFEDGITALDYLESNPVDVVLSDISMPRMDGLALSEKIAEKHPGTLVLLLTGFDEFQYAQEAVRHQVKEFLLKPITAEELEGVLKRTREELDRIRRNEAEQERLKEQLDASLPLLRERFFYSLVSGRIEKKDLVRRGAFLGWNGSEPGPFLICLAALPEDWDELARLALAEKARSICSENDVVFANRNEDLVLLLRGNEAKTLEQRTRRIAERLFAETINMGDSSVTFGIGEVVDHQEDLNRSYLGAGNAVDHTRILGLSRIQSIDEVRHKSRVSQEAFISRARRLVKALREADSMSARSALDDVFTMFEQSYLTSGDAVGYLARLQYYISDFIDEMGMADMEPFEKLALSTEPRKFRQLDEARVFFRELIGEFETQISCRRKGAALSRIDRAKTIISERFSDKAFSLQDICAELYLSTSQFSALFKEGTGHTFVEYLTEVRMDEARKLLKTTDMKSYEIAEQVGYQDPRYFSSIFKKVTGLTTTEFRRGLES